MSTSSPQQRTFLGRLPLPENTFLADALRQETTGGILLLIAAVLGIAAANSGFADAYESLAAFTFGPEALHLNLSIQAWSGDGLLAIFFFIAGLELKRELVVGSLSDRSEAILPVVAALCGMVVPALVFLAIAWGSPGATDGWAIPMATDIAFALAVLAVVGRSLPPALRAFLLTLAVVDDMGAIVVIALFYTSAIAFAPLAGAVAGLGLYAYLQRRRVQSTFIYAPLAFGVWALVHASGVHATIAGVALGLLTRVRPDPDEDHSPAERVEHRLRPLSAAIAVPIFAFFATGVVLSIDAFRALAEDRVAWGIILGLVVGKFVGVFGGTWLVARLTRAQLSEDLAWRDIAAVGLLAGIGFTVSLLITELAFAADAVQRDLATTAVLVGSVLAALLAAIVLHGRSAHYQALAEREAADEDHDGIPDVYQPRRGDEAED